MAERDLDQGGSVFGELRRLARTSGAVGGIAARLAGARIGLRTNRTAHAEDLRAVLGGLKGPLMKVAQLLSTIPDALPEEYAAELAHLQANAPPMGWSFVRRRMATELGPNWDSRYASFEREAAAAASLGQVHRATLHDGRLVAVKLQYPDMVSTVDADLRQLRVAMALYRRMDNAIQHDEVYKELAERLREELDYGREAAHLRLYRLMLDGRTDISIPEPIDALSSARLLTMTWLDGMSLQSYLDTSPDLDSRNAVARALFRAWYLPFYRYGVIHGDPHLGNFQVRADQGLNLLDFGAIRIFRPPFVQGVIDLQQAIERNDDEQAYHAYQGWGFTDISRDTMDVLNEWARFIYEPLLQDRVRPIQESDDPLFGRSVAERVHAGLKRTGGVGSVFLRLKANLNWHRLYHETVEGFAADDLAARQAAALSDARVPPPLDQG